MPEPTNIQADKYVKLNQELNTIDKLYKLVQMTGHDLATVKLFCLEAGVEVWWERYKRNPKYRRWHAQMARWESVEGLSEKPVWLDHTAHVRPHAYCHLCSPRERNEA